jgi:CubicO group peptidase (beta-lactamase class C family)
MKPQYLSIALAASLSLASAAGVQAQTPARPQASAVPVYRVEAGAPLPPKARAEAEAIVAAGVPGVSVMVGRKGQLHTNVNVGDMDATTQRPIASASKWLTAAVVLQLVGEGKLSLDKPISTWLPDTPPAAGAITLRQLLSQTSGLGPAGAEMAQDHRITLVESAKAATSNPPTTPPGSTFVYGGPGFQVAGAVVETVTGQPWEEVFQARIAKPLGMTQTHWTHFSRDLDAKFPLAETRNPVLQGGAVGDAQDYMRFLAMLAAGGKHDGHQILSPEAVAFLLADQTTSAKRTPSGVALLDSAHYALGNWCEAPDGAGQCGRNSSLGAWGVYPWIDRTSGLYGVVFFYERNDAFRLLPHTTALVADIIAQDRR